MSKTEGTYQVPWINRVNRRIMRPIFRGLFHLLGRVRLYGREHIPKQGAYVIAVNHISLIEVPFMAAFWPETLEIIGAADVWTRPGQNVIVRLYHGIQVRRGEFDRGVMDNALNVLASGRPLMIAPEGGRSHTPGMRRGQPGVSYIVDKARVPVVPVGVVGSTEEYIPDALRFKRPPLEMHVGKPVNLPPITGRGAERREARQRNADLVMAHIAALLPKEYRGFYENYQVFLSES